MSSLAKTLHPTPGDCTLAIEALACNLVGGCSECTGIVIPLPVFAMSVFALLTAGVLAGPPACQATSPAHIVVLVELFTSQGCSSCPPADRWLSGLKATDRIVPLSMHVNYWDHIGWKDPFANPAFTQRQQLRARANHSRSVYTPGVFVHGQELRRWADAREWRAAVQRYATTPAAAHIALRVQRTGDTLAVTAHTQARLHPQAQLHLALTHSGQVTRVTAGENRSEVLGNDHVVRAWSGPRALGTTVHRLSLPADQRGPLNLVALVEDGAEVLQVLAMPVPALAAGCGV